MIDWTRDEIILACALISRHGWQGLRAEQTSVQELSDLLRAAPIHPLRDRDDAFRSPSSVQRKTFDIATQHPSYFGKQTKGNKLDRIVLSEFLADPQYMQAVAAAITTTIEDGFVRRLLAEGVEGSDVEAREGSLLLTRHLLRERSPRLRSAKLQQAQVDGQGLLCEVCDFNFERTYGAVGRGYIEVHHRLPLHVSGPRTTKLRDLALLCSNCHRMMHRSKSWLTPEQLRHHVQAARASTPPDCSAE